MIRAAVCVILLGLTACGGDDDPHVVPDGGEADAALDATPDVPYDGPLAAFHNGPVVAAGGHLDLAAYVAGGQPPYSCVVYVGPGEGTVPQGVAQDLSGDSSGCTFIGAPSFAAGDQRGVYGFLVTVTDQNGDSVEVPLAYRSADCDVGAVSVSPAPWPVVVAAAGAPVSLALSITDVDAIEEEETCDSCTTLALLTRQPLVPTAQLDCAESGDVCSDCADDSCITAAATCPSMGAAEIHRMVDVKGHDPIRASAPAWLTLELSATYSGVSLVPCAGKSWTCHMEILETP